MGCGGSKDTKPTAQATNEPKAAVQPQPSTVGRKCPFCAKLFQPNELNTHTVTCPQRQVMCHHSWCRKIVKQSELQQHMSECLQGRKVLCPKCGEGFSPPDLSAHRTMCDVVQCQHCPERVIPRMIKYCPNIVLGKLQCRVGPFATDRLREKFLGAAATSPTSKGSPSFGRANSNNNLNATGTFGPMHQSVEFGSPLAMSRGSSQVNLSASVQGKANVHFQVARIQHLWRWAKAKAALEDLLFRMVYKELDNKKETFSIFKAHDHKFHDDDRSRAKRNAKTAAPVQAVGATAGHYFPSSATTPITVDVVHRVIEDYTRRIPLPYHAVWRIMNDSYALLKALPNINRLSPPEGARQLDGRWRQGGKVVVVGDLHGQLQDLLCILQDNGIPSDRCLYVFNGDFVDRGHNGVEILVILLLLFLVFPNYVSLNRGNHECEYMNEEYGFDLEVQTKYDRNIYKLMQRVFCALPLATVIGNRVFIVHAGLPRRGSVTFEDIDLVQRFRQIPMPELTQPEEDEIFQDLTWSDPKPENGWSESDRGVGCHFGPDVTETFCATNNIELVIRSHEECAKGYEIHHGGKLLTVFSCSNYDGAGSNMGAVIFLFGTSSEWSQHTFTCSEEDYLVSEHHPAEKLGGMNPVTPYSALGRTMSATSFGATFVGKDDSSFGHFCASLLGSINMFVMDKDSNLGILQPWHSSRRSRDDVLGALRERIFDRRHRLLGYFTKLDRTQKGSIWKMEWVETLNVVLNLDIPWFFLRPSLTHTEPISDRIRYVSFLARFRTAVSDLYITYWATSTLAQLHYAIFGRRRHPVAKTLAEKTEPLGYIEFNALIHQVSEALTDNETFHLYLYLANDGKWNSFITGPSVIAAMDAAVNTFENDPAYDETGEDFLGWDLTTMDQLAHIIVRVGAAQLHKVFQLTVKDTPITSSTVFQEGLYSLGRGLKRPIELRPKVVKLLWEYLQKHCLEPDLGVTVDELIMAFTVRDFTALSERRDAYHEVIDILLGDRSGTMHRRYSTTFMGFGPTPPVEFTSPIPGTLQPPWHVAQPTMVLSGATSNGPLMPPPQDLGRSLEDTPIDSASGNSPVPRGRMARRGTMANAAPSEASSTPEPNGAGQTPGQTSAERTPPETTSPSVPAPVPQQPAH